MTDCRAWRDWVEYGRSSLSADRLVDEGEERGKKGGGEAYPPQSLQTPQE